MQFSSIPLYLCRLFPHTCHLFFVPNVTCLCLGQTLWKKVSNLHILQFVLRHETLETSLTFKKGSSYMSHYVSYVNIYMISKKKEKIPSKMIRGVGLCNHSRVWRVYIYVIETTVPPMFMHGCRTVTYLTLPTIYLNYLPTYLFDRTGPPLSEVSSPFSSFSLFCSRPFLGS